MDPYDNTNTCDCCVAKHPDYDKPVKECPSALVDVMIGNHRFPEKLLPFVDQEHLDYGNCRPVDECCDEPNEYYCDVLQACHPIHKPCCHECEHHVFDPHSIDAFPPSMNLVCVDDPHGPSVG